jgi:hypothetical protein
MGFECNTFSLESKIPECCNSFFFPWKPNIPDVKAIWVCGTLWHEHALSIDSPVILDAIFTFRLRTCHLEVLYAMDGRCYLKRIVVGSCVDGAAKHFNTQSYAFTVTPET